LWWGGVSLRAPWLIWVRGGVAGDVMVAGSVRVGRLRPLGLLWAAAGWREPRAFWELAGSSGRIVDAAGSVQGA
jgi:hypothetical protein